MRVWVTRTQPGAALTARRLRAAGHDAVVAPVLAYRLLPVESIDLTDATALAFTSRNAVRAFAAFTPRRDFGVYVVGNGTAQAAREIGFNHVEVADGDVRDLAALIRREGVSHGVLVWPGPTEPAADLVAELGDEVRARFQPIYETHQTGTPAPADIEAVLIHSAKGAKAAASLITPDAARGLSLFAISNAAAAPLRDLPFSRVAVAPRPSETALLAMIAG